MDFDLNDMKSSDWTELTRRIADGDEVMMIKLINHRIQAALKQTYSREICTSLRQIITAIPGVVENDDLFKKVIELHNIFIQADIAFNLGTLAWSMKKEIR